MFHYCYPAGDWCWWHRYVDDLMMVTLGRWKESVAIIHHKHRCYYQLGSVVRPTVGSQLQTRSQTSYPAFTMNKFNKMTGSMSECLIHDYTKWTDISTRNKNWMGRYEFVFNYFWTNIKSFVFETCKNLIWFGQTIKTKIPGIGLLKLLLIPIKMYSLILQSKHFSFTVHFLLNTGT